MKTLDELLECLRVRFDDGTDPHLWGVYMDMIKSAAAREREAVTDCNHIGNAAALRDAVVALLDALDSLGCDEETDTLAAFVPDMADSSAKCLAAFRKAKSALAVPSRNCDVGTADEQSERFTKYCKMFPRCRGCECCGKVIFGKCELAWAQMPYEQEGAGK